MLVALENLFPPIPSELVLPLAGFIAASGNASVGGMVVAATVGSMTGAYTLYGVSAGNRPCPAASRGKRYGKWLGLSEEDLDRPRTGSTRGRGWW